MSDQVWLSKDDGFDECALFDCSDDTEMLAHSEPEEAIEAALDQWLDPKCNVLEHLCTAVGETLTIYGYTRRKLGANDPNPDWFLEALLERLDEEYGGEDATQPTPSMIAAAETFAEAIRAEYSVWQCEPTHKAMVNVEAWVREYRPDWLEPETALDAPGAIK